MSKTPKKATTKTKRKKIFYSASFLPAGKVKVKTTHKGKPVAF